MIFRQITKELKTQLKEFPVVTILGPRQSGKTTLAKETLKKYHYINLENPQTRQFAQSDPKSFLKELEGKKVILDEIQRVPELLSYIQVIVDETKANGQFVLTGSHQFDLQNSISQSLAGRTGILTLLPLSMEELKKSSIEFDDFSEYALNGFMPRLYDQKQRPKSTYSAYYKTYIERDLRQIINIKEISLFEKFMKLLAGRAGQLIDYNSLANDVGCSATNIKHWLSVLEASFVIYKLNPYFENFGKRVIKSPKYYFTEIGLLIYLLEIETATQVRRDPLLGGIFENLVIMECVKKKLNQGKSDNFYFFRDSNHNEIDLMYKNGPDIVIIEIKAATSYNSALLKNINRFQKLKENTQSFLVYNGETRRHQKVDLLNFKACNRAII